MILFYFFFRIEYFTKHCSLLITVSLILYICLYIFSECALHQTNRGVVLLVETSPISFGHSQCVKKKSYFSPLFFLFDCANSSPSA